MKLSLTRPHDTDADTLRRRVEAMQSRLHSRYRARTKWQSASTLSIGAPGVRGRLALGDDDMHVDLELSAVLRPLRRRIERELGRELDRVASRSRRRSRNS